MEEKYFPIKNVFKTVGFGHHKAIYALVDSGVLPLSAKACEKGVGQRRVVNFRDYLLICLSYVMLRMDFDHDDLRKIFSCTGVIDYIDRKIKSGTKKKMYLAYLSLGIEEKDYIKMKKREAYKWLKYHGRLCFVVNINKFKKLVSDELFDSYVFVDVGKLLDQIQARFKTL